MLRITPVALDVVRRLQPLIRAARKGERNLADQLDRSSTSVHANLCEGNAASGATRRYAYGVALREARETVGWLDVARVKGFVVPDVSRELDHVIGVLVKLTHRAC